MKFSALRCCVCVGVVLATGAVIGCKGGNAPGPQDDIAVHAPGTVVKADEHGVVVNAPLGIQVRVGENGVAVQAPGVNVTTGANGVAVTAPGVNVKADSTGVAVDGPVGVTVRTGAATQP